MRELLAIGLLAVTLAVQAQEPALRWEARLELDREHLDHDMPDWSEAVLQLTWRPQKSLAVLGGMRETERFAQRDHEGFAGAYLPLGTDTTVLHVEGSASATHRVIAKWMALAEVAQTLAPGWVATAGAKAARYDTGDVHTMLASIEKYFGEYRLGYNLYLSRPQGGSWSPSHRFSASWYRGGLTFVTLSAGRGREVENIFPDGLLVTDVRSASIGGGLQVAPSWGLTFEAAVVQQGDLYTRRGLRLGSRVLF